MALEKCSLCGDEFPSSMIGLDGRCPKCLQDEPECCENCGEELNQKEIDYGEDLCFPCLKGN